MNEQKKRKTTDPRIVMLKKVILAFPTLNEPESYENSPPRYSATALIQPGSEQYKQVMEALKETARMAWPNKDPLEMIRAIRNTGKLCFQDGNTKEYEGFPGNWFIRCHARADSPPLLLDGYAKELPRNTTMLYSGCEVNIQISFWAIDGKKKPKYGNQINAQVMGVQYAGPGTRFSGGRPSDSSDFEPVEGAHDTGDDWGEQNTASEDDQWSNDVDDLV